ncbi:MAG: hypothetical protein IPJ69_04190 [Deltaproteobacteria bacterium]|nr:MAG: hypothetical protein IPJ69_04190 [Deltaproteobacteria bacterium]
MKCSYCRVLGFLILAVSFFVCSLGVAEDSRDKVYKRTSQIEMYPCAECHSSAADFNFVKRELKKEHTDILSLHPKQRVGEDANYWCHNCHNPGEYNQLRLQSGEVIGFNDSQRLCGQCHGTQLEDWKERIHGRRTGLWNGEGRVDLCTQCHNPHDPHFKSMKPLPPPPKPAWILREQKSQEGGTP